MSKFECDLVADLLPRYIDKKCTKETADYIIGHIASCEDCRDMLEAMTSEIEGMVPEKTQRHKFRIGGGLKVLYIVLGYLAIVIVALIIFSYILVNGVM